MTSTRKSDNTTNCPQLTALRCLDENQGRAVKPSNSARSLFTRVGQGAVAMLLASPLAAQARPMLPAGTSGLHSGGARALLATCPQGNWSGPVPGTYPAFSDNSPLASISSSFVWSQALNTSCAPGAAKTQPLNMTDVPLTLGFSQFAKVPGAIGTLSNSTIEQIYHDLANLSQFVNVQVQLPNTADGALPAVVFVQGLDGSASSPWTEKMLQGDGTAVVSSVDSDNTEAQPRLAALGAALGLVSPGAFSGSNIASVTTTSTNDTCTQPSRFGAYDLAVLAAKYGFSARASGNQTITLSENFGSGGILASATGNNTLRAVYNGNLTVQLSAVDDGTWPSLVGESAVLLAPGSVITNIDASQTPGVVIIGNNHTNYITCSGTENGDTVSVGSGLTYLGAGTNQTSLVLNYPNTTVVWNGVTDDDVDGIGIYVAYGQPDQVGDSTPNGTLASLGNGSGSQLTFSDDIVVQFPYVEPHFFLGPYSLADWSLNDGIDYSVPVPCSSLLAPIYIPDSTPPTLPSPPPPVLAPPPPPKSTPAGGDTGGTASGGFGNNVPGFSGWIDPYLR